MWSKKTESNPNWVSIANSRNSAVNQPLSPINFQKPKLQFDNSRRSVTPTRGQDRVSTSPLRVPLEQAIEKCLRDKSMDRSRSRAAGPSSRRSDFSNTSFLGKLAEEETSDHQVKAHAETLSFLNKYFGKDQVISTQIFIDKVLHEYEDLWGNQNVEQILQNFTFKISEIFGVDGVDSRELVSRTREDGMIGLILQIFQSIKQDEYCLSSNYMSFSKNPQVMSINRSFDEQLSECANVMHIKNVIQEFMETMYQSMETEIYNKFNVQMKRMVLKYRETERLVKKMQEKLTLNADIFEVEKQLKQREKVNDENTAEWKKKLDQAEESLKKERQIATELKVSKAKLEEEVTKLKENGEKLQNILISKLENVESNPSLRRMNSSALADRTQEYNNIQQKEAQPFQIKIDTHFIQRDMQTGQPLPYAETQAYSPVPQHQFLQQYQPQQYPTQQFQQIPPYTAHLTHSPMKFNQETYDGRPSYESKLASREYSCSPFKSRGSRAL